MTTAARSSSLVAAIVVLAVPLPAASIPQRRADLVRRDYAQRIECSAAGCATMPVDG